MVSRRRRWLSLTVAALVAYLVIGGALYAFQRRFIYPAPTRAEAPKVDRAALITTQGPQGRTVYALHLLAPPGKPTLVHFHGNGQELADLVGLAWLFRRAGLGFYAVEYPGYGLAREYEPSEAAIYADAEAALWHLHNSRQVSPGQVVIQGQSLGSAVAVEMSRRGHGTHLVLISPFTSMPDMAFRRFPIYPTRWLVHDKYDSAVKAPELKVPVLVVHGTVDRLVPISMGEELVRLFPNARIHAVAGAGHNDLWVREGDDIVTNIAGFVGG